MKTSKCNCGFCGGRTEIEAGCENSSGINLLLNSKYFNMLFNELSKIKEFADI